MQVQPNNNYAKYNIFVNLTLNPTDYKFNKDFFLNNLKSIKISFQTIQMYLIKYYDLAKLLKYNEWILFFESLLFQKK